MTKLVIELPEEDREFLEAQAALEGLANPGQYVSRLLARVRLKMDDEELELELMKGLNSGPPIVVDDEYWKAKSAALEAKLREQRGR